MFPRLRTVRRTNGYPVNERRRSPRHGVPPSWKKTPERKHVRRSREPPTDTAPTCAFCCPKGSGQCLDGDPANFSCRRSQRPDIVANTSRTADLNGFSRYPPPIGDREKSGLREVSRSLFEAWGDDWKSPDPVVGRHGGTGAGPVVTAGSSHRRDGLETGGGTTPFRRSHSGVSSGVSSNVKGETRTTGRRLSRWPRPVPHPRRRSRPRTAPTPRDDSGGGIPLLLRSPNPRPGFSRSPYCEVVAPWGMTFPDDFR